MLYPDKPPPDHRDPEERAAVAAIIEELPSEHPARKAYAKGATTIELTRLVGRPELAERLTQAHLDGYSRMPRRQGQFRP